MTAAFVPTLQEELHANGKEGTFQLLSKVASWLLVVTGGLVVLAMALFATRGSSRLRDKWYVAADLAVILFPYLAMISLAAGLQRDPQRPPALLRAGALADLAQPRDDRGPRGGGPPLREHAARRDPLALRRRGSWAASCRWPCPAGVLIREGWRPRFDLGLSPRVREIAA
jgi:putative peptidoglycan lipid II flippase